MAMKVSAGLYMIIAKNFDTVNTYDYDAPES